MHPATFCTATNPGAPCPASRTWVPRIESRTATNPGAPCPDFRTWVPSAPQTRRLTLAALTLAGLSLALLLATPARALSALGGHLSDHANTRGYLGVNFRDVVTEQLATLKLKDPRGAEIFVVDHDGPGCKAGLREHDVILQMNGQPIEGEDDLRKLLHDVPAGRTVAFGISRDGQPATISVQLADRNTVGQKAWEKHMTIPEPTDSGWRGTGFFGGNTPSAADLPRHSFLGTTILSSSYTGALLELMGPQLADFFGAQTGLLVRAVDPNSPAAAAGLRAGDVVVRINAIPVVNSADWLKTVHDHRGKPVAVVVLRDRKEQILTLTPDSKKRSSVMPHIWPGSKSHTDPNVAALRPAGMQ